jgi:serine/threonine-protein kinase
MSDQHFQIVGRYLLGSPIASGGMATVYLGRPLSLPRVVAVKRLSPVLSGDATFVRMFLDEVQLLCRIRHKNVVAPIEHFQRGGEFFIVMEYVEGLSLAQLSSAWEGHLDILLASKIMCGVLTGLHAAHEAFDSSGQPLNMVHRDVSPHNILVGTDGESRIVDFGIAKAAWRAHVTQHGERKGKPGYMAPEQWTLSEVDRRTDIYAAGVVMWELLTGTRLFSDVPMRDGSSAFREAIAAPSTLRKGLSPALDEVTLRALSIDPRHRFPDAEAMASALRAAAAPARDVDLGSWVAACGKRELTRRAALITELESVRPSEFTPVNRGFAVSERASTLPEIPASPVQETVPPSARRIAPGSPGGFKQAAAMALTFVAALVGASFVAQSRNPPAVPDPHRDTTGAERARSGGDHGVAVHDSVAAGPALAQETTRPEQAPNARSDLDRPIASSWPLAASAVPAVSVAPTVRVPGTRSAAAITSAAPAYDPLRDARRR